jgi:hypothetical protein
MQESAATAKEPKSLHEQILEIMSYAESGDWFFSGTHFNPHRMFHRSFGRRSGGGEDHMRAPFKEGHARNTADMFDDLAKVVRVEKLDASEQVEIAAVMFNPRLVASIEKPSILAQALAASLDPALLVELKIFHPEVQFAVLTSHVGASLFSEHSEAFDLVSMEISHPGITACVSVIKGADESNVLQDRIEQYRRYGTVSKETAQMLSVLRDPAAFAKMKNPSEAVQVEMVKHHPEAIKRIASPSEAIMRLAVSARPEHIALIKNPPQSICILAAGLNARLFSYVENPSTELLLKALKVHAGYIKDMVTYPQFDALVSGLVESEYPGDALIALNKIGRSTEEFNLAAVRANGELIKYINTPSEEVKVAAVGTTPRAITYLTKPSEALQILAMTKEPALLLSIKEPCAAARYLALSDAVGVRRWKDAPVKFGIEAVEEAYPGIRECLSTAKSLGLNNPGIAAMVKKFQLEHPAVAAPQDAPSI